MPQIKVRIEDGGAVIADVSVPVGTTLHDLQVKLGIDGKVDLGRAVVDGQLATAETQLKKDTTVSTVPRTGTNG